LTSSPFWFPSPSSTTLLISLLDYSFFHVNDVSVYLESSKVMRVISDSVTSPNVSQHEVPWSHRDDYLPATSMSLPYSVGVMRVLGTIELGEAMILDFRVM